MDLYEVVKPKNKDNKFCWKKDVDKHLWEVYKPEELEVKDEQALETAAIIYQMCTNEEFRESKHKMFFTMFYYFYPESSLFFDSLFEFYESPLKLTDTKLAKEIQEGLLKFLEKGFSLKYGHFKEIFFKNKIFQKKAFQFAEKLEKNDCSFLTEKINLFISFEFSNNFVEFPHPSIKLKKFNPIKSFNIEQVLLGNLDLTSLDPQFLAVNCYYLQKNIISQIQHTELIDTMWSKQCF